MTRMDNTVDEAWALDYACGYCGAETSAWCETTSGAPADKLHTLRRTGGEYCSAVDSNECLSPAGWGGSYGYAAAPGVEHGSLNTCGYCGEPVCTPCSTRMTPPAFFEDQTPASICLNHSEHELANWLGL